MDAWPIIALEICGGRVFPGRAAGWHFRLLARPLFVFNLMADNKSTFEGDAATYCTGVVTAWPFDTT